MRGSGVCPQPKTLPAAAAEHGEGTDGRKQEKPLETETEGGW